ncbi:acetyl-CoA synthetase-like protein [Macrolepiota fuliginosa MF-IS2]|uniref:Acetyl-CoA synthetase-like protein n=1 Tax=Macrolepiota fuliginosa MF-IS2 TaxID=1400762 RepID=A0A9P5XHP1_9AGAR|nr:acetyl-CoA synthetase-like protein [Macrolepiota fuliginosa MF-IS2]
MATLPCPQAQNSPTFTPPPLDGSLTVPEIYDYHLGHSSTHPLFVYDCDSAVQTITWKQAVQAIHTAARSLRSIPTLQDTRDVPVVAILAVIDQLSYFALTAGIMRAGYRAFPISPRNSDCGVANLLQKTRARHLIVSKDEAMQRTAKAARQLLLADEISSEVFLLDAPSFGDLFSDQGQYFAALPPMRSMSADDVALILHSSGSTSFPKPISLSHRNLIQWGAQPYYGETDLCGRVLSNHSLPFFHAMGIVSLSWATMTGVIISNFAPRDPPVMATPENLFNSAVACQSRLILCVPTFLEEWSHSQEKLIELQKFKAIMFGGAPVQKAVGDKLSNLGIHLYPFYGATELGGTCSFLPRVPPSEGWEYFKISAHSKPVFLEHDAGASIYQLLIEESRLSAATSSHTPAVINTLYNGNNAYDTNDLVIRHPTNPILIKIYGRADDQIMHSTGEKTNPVPMETIINRHPMVQSSVIFGRGRFQAGVLIEPRAEHVFDPSDTERLMSFRHAVWSSVEEANNFGPSHSRIFKEMILVAHPSKAFHYTAKGTPRRQFIINEYEKEIEQGYIDLEKASFVQVDAPEILNMEKSRLYVSQLVEQVMGRELRDGDDFFLCGCDSLKATWIRNNLLNILHSINVDTTSIPVNFIYLYPTTSRLSGYLSSLTSGREPDLAEGAVERMNDLVRKYSVDFPQHRPTTNEIPVTETVLLTGSTGGLGSYTLENLILDNAVSKIYCLNRKGRTGSLERQKSAFKGRGIDLALLNSGKLVFIEGETDHPYLGMGKEQYEEVRDNITTVLHVAWRVDFNISISSTEPLIAGVRALIELCLSSPHKEPPRLVFASSISVVRNWRNGPAPETALPDATIAVGSGYPESKWVAEQVLNSAAQVAVFKPVIVRIGQLSGARNGFWGLSEWVPSVVQTAPILQCLPDTSGHVSWIPVHLAANAFAKMRSSPRSFLHLIHPNPTTWTKVFGLVSKTLNIPLVPYGKWLSALEESAKSSSKLPASSLQLMDFYQSVNKVFNSEADEAFGFPQLSTTQAEAVVPTLSSLPQLGTEDVASWLSYWTSAGALA